MEGSSEREGVVDGKYGGGVSTELDDGRSDTEGWEVEGWLERVGWLETDGWKDDEG